MNTVKFFAQVAALSFVMATTALAQAGKCDAILKHGVFETASRLDIRSTYDMMQNENCGSSGSDGDLTADGVKVGFGSRKDFCSKSKTEAVQYLLTYDTSRRASSTLATAWTECQRRAQGFTEQVSISPADPAKVTYRVAFSSVMNVRARVTSFTLDNLKGCSVQNNQEIGPGGLTLICTRPNVCTTARIVLNTTVGSPDALAASEIPAAAPTLKVVSLRELDPEPDNVPLGASRQCSINCAGERRTPGSPRGDCEVPRFTSQNIRFGTWENGHCNVSGKGWHAVGFGTCGTSLGNGTKRCSEVKVSYLQPYGTCPAP